MTTRILKWLIPVDDKEHEVKGHFLHAEPMTELEREQGANIAARGESPHEWVTVWTRVGEAYPYDQTHQYLICGTGHEIPDRLIYMASVRQEPFVWHILREPTEDEHWPARGHRALTNKEE